MLLNEVFGVGKLPIQLQQPELASSAEVRNSPTQPSERRPRAVPPTPHNYPVGHWLLSTRTVHQVSK